MAKITHDTLAGVLAEIYDQPPWRSAADREMDYADGNQLSSDVLQKLQAKGIPPSIENVIGPAIEDIAGMEAKNRTDWRVQPDSDDDPEAEQVAKALNYKLNQAERRSGADRALGEMYLALAKIGIGWVEISRDSDPFRFPYRVQSVHRNEIWWDWYSKRADLSDARWLLRRRWVSLDAATMMFPRHKELIMRSGMGWGNIDDLAILSSDAGSSTDLAQSWDIERGWSVEEQEWRDPLGKRVCLFQLFSRDYEQAQILRMPGGRVVEVDLNDPMHIMAINSGAQIEKTNVARIHSTIFLGPHVLESERSEFSRYPLVAAFGRREDRTNVPYGTVRWLMYLQDEINVRASKMQWLLSATRTIRTKGAVKMADEVFRYEVGRPDADIILDSEHMAKAGAQFKLEYDLDLNRQQFERLSDLRNSVKKISGVSDAFSGDGGHNTAQGLSTLVEQSVQSLAVLNDNFAYARQQVGELILGMIVRDMGSSPEQVVIAGGGLRDDETIVLNSPAPPDADRPLNNDVQQTVLKVVLEDVPSTPSFRQQQLAAMSEAFKSAPPQYQSVMMPHLMHLANVPNKEDIIKQIVDINKNAMITEDQVEERVKQAVDAEKTKWLVEQKTRELDLKEAKQTAEIQKIIAETVSKSIEAIYSGTQAGAQIMSIPGVAAAADQVLNSAGFEDKDNSPIVAPPGGPIVAPPRQNTSPMFPPRAEEAVAPEPMVPELDTVDPGAAEGMNRGIEEPGIQV